MAVVDRARFLRAIRQKESSGGVNNCPRFEPAYLKAGTYCIQGHEVIGTEAAWNDLVARRWSKWGMASAASYGDHQILYHTAADLGFIVGPWMLWDPTSNMLWAERLFDRIQRTGASTVRDYADAWNSGNWRDKLVVEDYTTDIERHYEADIVS